MQDDIDYLLELGFVHNSVLGDKNYSTTLTYCARENICCTYNIFTATWNIGKEKSISVVTEPGRKILPVGTLRKYFIETLAILKQEYVQIAKKSLDILDDISLVIHDC